MSDFESFVQQAAGDKALRQKIATGIAEAVTEVGSAEGYGFTADDIRSYMRGHGWSMQSFLDHAPTA